MSASSAEIVCALGFGDWLVGRSHVDAKQLCRLKPDVILTQSQCEVCAVTVSDVEKAACERTGGTPTIVSLGSNSLEDIWDDIRKVAAAVEFPGHGEALVKDLKRRVSDIGERCAAVKTRPRVAMIERIDPLTAGGNWVPELVDIAGGDNLFGEAGRHSPRMEWKDLVAGDPDIIIALPCCFDLDRTRKEMGALAGRFGWKELQAVRLEGTPGGSGGPGLRRRREAVL